MDSDESHQTSSRDGQTPATSASGASSAAPIITAEEVAAKSAPTSKAEAPASESTSAHPAAHSSLTSSTGDIPLHVLEKITNCRITNNRGGGGGEGDQVGEDDRGITAPISCPTTTTSPGQDQLQEVDEKQRYRPHRPGVVSNNVNTNQQQHLPGAVRVVGIDGSAASEELELDPTSASFSSSRGNNSHTNPNREVMTRSIVADMFGGSSWQGSGDQGNSNAFKSNNVSEDASASEWAEEANRILLAFERGNGEDTTNEDDDDDHMSCVSMHSVHSITATPVDDHKEEQKIRKKIMGEAVEATVVKSGDVDDEATTCFGYHHNVFWKAAAVLMCLLLVVVIIVVAVFSMKDDDNGGQTSPEQQEQQQEQVEDNEFGGIMIGGDVPVVVVDSRPTIDKVKARGYLRCNTWGTTSGFSFPNNETGKFEGLNVDHCRAISIALFGNPDQYEIVKEEVKDSFTLLEKGEVDVVSAAFTHNMARDLFDKSSQAALTFTTPYFYSHLAFAGIPEYVDCADNLDSLFGICRGVTVCVLVGTTHVEHIDELMPGADVIAVQSLDDEVIKLKDGTCNVIVSEPIFLPVKAFRELGYEGPFKMGERMFTREPLTMQTRSDDAEWSNLLDLIINIFFLAESKGITKGNADELRPYFADDKEVADMMVAIVSEFGNYGDLYEKHLENILPRQGLNRLYDPTVDKTGLLYSLPFGKRDLAVEGPDPIVDGSLATILSRGYLRCGVRPRPGFATKVEAPAVAEEGQQQLRGTGGVGESSSSSASWQGFDVEFCRGIAAALFEQVANNVVFVEIGEAEAADDGYSLLASGEVDIVAGQLVSLQADYLEPTTGRRYSFSPPYFYDKDGRAHTLMTMEQSDSQFDDMVYWIVMALIYADEHQITSASSFEMPVMKLLGDDLKQMLRDCVLAVGSYGNIYNRTLEATIPRSGANKVNTDQEPGPQHFAIPYQLR